MLQSVEIVETVPAEEVQRPAHWFKPGQSGNPKGRQKGARNKLADAFITELYEDFKDNGVSAIRQCRIYKPDVYLNVIAKVIPAKLDVTADESVADLASGLHAVADFLGSFAAEASRADHAGALPDGSVLSVGVRPSEG